MGKKEKRRRKQAKRARQRARQEHTKEVPRRRLRKVDILAGVVMGLFLVMLWTQCIMYIVSGNLVGHTNYYGQPIGAFLLLAVLLIITPVSVYMAWKRIWEKEPKKDASKKKEPDEPRPAWLDEPPYKFPWE